MKSVRTILRKTKVRFPDGHTLTLGAYLKNIPPDAMRTDLIKMLEGSITRLEATQDKQVLIDFYAVFIALNFGGESTIHIQGEP